eukprot:TRINITY_DN15241_c0_g1_i2.p1 TRINITY_DN15241_c0_g1~~TRINITY_DN15241_c0_g1_i2.p1  ORF type:complete len:303 (-),score=71.14 TRINITY_DN15241_c0_g1_i2:123-983(-)
MAAATAISGVAVVPKLALSAVAIAARTADDCAAEACADVGRSAREMERESAPDLRGARSAADDGGGSCADVGRCARETAAEVRVARVLEELLSGLDDTILAPAGRGPEDTGRPVLGGDMDDEGDGDPDESEFVSNFGYAPGEEDDIDVQASQVANSLMEVQSQMRPKQRRGHQHGSLRRKRRRGQRRAAAQKLRRGERTPALDSDPRALATTIGECWVMRNTWGDRWADGGYFRMATDQLTGPEGLHVHIASAAADGPHSAPRGAARNGQAASDASSAPGSPGRSP